MQKIPILLKLYHEGKWNVEGALMLFFPSLLFHALAAPPLLSSSVELRSCLLHISLTLLPEATAVLIYGTADQFCLFLDFKQMNLFTRYFSMLGFFLSK